MKKYLLSSLLAIAAVFASCEAEQQPEINGENVDVKFAVDVACEQSTRAISDGTGADQLMYAVFNESGELVIGKEVKNNVTSLLDNEGYTMSISLAKGQTYKVVFWAQNSECNAYQVSEDMNVTINYSGINNDETRDAFFGSTNFFKVKGDETVSVVLKRPFAQVNVGAFPFDFEYVQDLGVNVEVSSAKFAGIPNKLNLLTGKAEGEVEVNYTLNDIPNEDLLVDVDGDGTNEVYTYISMSYILASPESTTHEMSFVFAEKDGSNPVDFYEGLSYVPVQRNWRTNIVGQILSGDIAFNVKIDPIYEGETINSAGLYYNFSNDTEIKNKVFAFNSLDHEAVFTTENNNLLTLDSVTFSGKIFQIAIGEYRGNKEYEVPYTNVLKNVTAKNLVIANHILNVGLLDYMSIGIFLRGVTTLEDCSFTGTTTTAEPYVYKGVEYPYLPYDCGVPNFCVATFERCTIDRLYAWSHAQITINNSKVGYITCHTHKMTHSTAMLTIGVGTEVDTIRVTTTNESRTPWPPCITIKEGATVNVLDLNGRPKDNLVIEEGAVVKSIINDPTADE